MFMVMEGDHPIGCIGIRYRDGVWDLYNVIRGVSTIGSVGFMSLALNYIVVFARDLHSVDIYCFVVAGNLALSWYLRNGFVVVDNGLQFTKLRYNFVNVHY